VKKITITTDKDDIRVFAQPKTRKETKMTNEETKAEETKAKAIREFKEWVTGPRDRPFLCSDEGYFRFTAAFVVKNDDFDYLYVQRGCGGKGIARNLKLEFAGVLFKRDGRIYDPDPILPGRSDPGSDLYGPSGKELFKQLRNNVRAKIENAVGNDRRNLSVTELGDEKRRNLEAFKERGYAINAARKRFIDGRTPNTRFECDYIPDEQTDDSLLSYLSDRETYEQKEAEAYMTSRQEDILYRFLEEDAIGEAYEAMARNPEGSVHVVKRIVDAMKDVSAKTVNVTLAKDGNKLTFKTGADEFRSDRPSGYGVWRMPEKSYREFEELFGYGAHIYRPEDILLITHGRTVLYDAKGQ
jgi:hypothetical protein